MSNFYAIFHANLAFSAIEEEELPHVIDQCYFPLLDLIESNRIPLAIELSAYTLERISELRPQWILKFKLLHDNGLVELIGSGYSQVIGPLVPYDVNFKNQKIGLQIYQSILGIKPNIAFVNEQVFSKSLVDIYYEVGYQSIAMEWNNAFSKHPEWEKSYSYNPVLVKGLTNSLPILWTDSIFFQYFQRAAHNEDTINEYTEKILKLVNSGHMNIPVYSSDLEVFNYRPGRFETEIALQADEWTNIKKILIKLLSSGTFQLPSSIIDTQLNKNVCLDMTSSVTPILVKKQSKYSLSRWAACGRGATYINNLCFKYYKDINYSDDNLLWKQLLQFWGSDYRTHITEKKWNKAIKFLLSNIAMTKNIQEKGVGIDENSFNVKDNGKQLIIKVENYKFIFLLAKGLCLDAVEVGEKKLPFGTIKHGEFDCISYGADFYTGTTVIESAENGRTTDLKQVDDYEVIMKSPKELTIVSKIILKELGLVEKKWIINIPDKKLTFDAEVLLNKAINGSIRMGTFTLLARAVTKPFWYKVKNGGDNYEQFIIDQSTNIEHHKAQSLLQSSQNGLGLTDGTINFGADNSNFVNLKIDQSRSYPFVMLQNNIIHKQFLTRLFFSMQELDDTSKKNSFLHHALSYSISIE